MILIVTHMNTLVLVALLALFNAAWLLERACGKKIRMCGIMSSTTKWTTALGFIVAAVVWLSGLVRSQGIWLLGAPLLLASVASIWLTTSPILKGTTTPKRLARDNLSIVSVATGASLLLGVVIGFYDVATA